MSTGTLAEVVYLEGSIGDPQAFLHDSGVLTEVNGDAPLLLSAADKDVWVQPLGSEPMTVGRTDTVTSRTLGKHYTHGKLYGEQIGGQAYDVQWFPSPSYTNGLAAGLGLRPGQDVFAVQHAVGADKLSHVDFCRYAAAGKLPQSTGSELFRHDRLDDHVVGALCMPPHVTANILAYVRAAFTERDSQPGWRQRFRNWGGADSDPFTPAAHLFDRTTATVSSLLELLVESDSVDGAVRAVLSNNSPFNFAQYLVNSCPSEGWDASEPLPKSLEGRTRYMAEVLLDHYAVLAPKLAALPAST